MSLMVGEVRPAEAIVIGCEDDERSDCPDEGASQSGSRSSSDEEEARDAGLWMLTELAAAEGEEAAAVAGVIGW
jgi:hypothetical protein